MQRSARLDFMESSRLSSEDWGLPRFIQEDDSQPVLHRYTALIAADVPELTTC